MAKIHLIAVLVLCYETVQSVPLDASIIKSNVASAIQSEAILIGRQVMDRYDNWNDRKSHIESHFDSVYGRKWTCLMGKTDSFSSKLPETDGNFLAFTFGDTEVVLSRHINIAITHEPVADSPVAATETPLEEKALQTLGWSSEIYNIGKRIWNELF